MSDDLQPLNWLLNTKCPDINQSEVKPKTSSKKSLEYILKNARNVVEESKNTPTIRPPLSYATLILLSLNSAPGKTLTLSAIYKWIKSTFKYYENTSGAKAVQWKNSIRHNLSLNKCFVKVPRGEGERGKGGFWTLDKQCERKLVNGENFYRLRKRRKAKMGGICREEVISSDGQECLGVLDWSSGDGMSTGSAQASVPDPNEASLEALESSVIEAAASASTKACPSLIEMSSADQIPMPPLQIPDPVHLHLDPLSSGPEDLSSVTLLQEIPCVEPLLSLGSEASENAPYYELLPVEWTFELYGDPKGACFDFPGLELDLEAWIG